MATVAAVLGFVLAAVGVAGLLARPNGPEEPLVTGSRTARGRTFTGLVITFPPRRAVLSVVGCAGVALLGVCMVLSGALWGGVLVIAVFTLAGTINVLTARRALVITETELAFLAGIALASVEWRHVDSVRRVRVPGRYGARGAELLAVHALWVKRAGARAVTGDGDELKIPLAVAGVPADWLTALVRECAYDEQKRRRVAAGDLQS